MCAGFYLFLLYLYFCIIHDMTTDLDFTCLTYDVSTLKHHLYFFCRYCFALRHHFLISSTNHFCLPIWLLISFLFLFLQAVLLLFLSICHLSPFLLYLCQLFIIFVKDILYLIVFSPRIFFLIVTFAAYEYWVIYYRDIVIYRKQYKAVCC